MKAREGLVALLPRGFSAVEAQPRTAGIALRLLPQLPIRAVLLIDLFQ
jgi:hypothetical protein